MTDLVVENISVLARESVLVDDASFRLGCGEFVALLGPNGAGKTTTMKSIMQLVRPRQGKIIYQGQDITGWPSHKVARNGLGYVPEERRIFPQLTVLENLEVGRQPPRDGCTTWTEDMVFDLFPNLAERRHNRGKALSRVGMGRCQGRYCQLAGAEVLAAKAGVRVAQVGRLRSQPPVRPAPISAYVSDTRKDGAE